MLTLVLSISACDDTVEFTIYFDSNGGTEVLPVTTNGAETVAIPDNPTKEGCTFGGWYWDDVTFETPFTANSLMDAPLSSDMTVYAKWGVNQLSAKDFYVTGQFAGWGDAPGNAAYLMEAICIEDTRVASIYEELEGATYIYLLEIILPDSGAGWDVTYKIDGTVTVLDGNLTVKIIRTDADDVVPNWWAQSPESGEIMSMTPDTLYIPPFVEENVNQAGGWNDNPVALAAGTYYAVYAEFGVGEAKGLGLIPTN